MTAGVIATEFDENAHAGLPGPLPQGERIVWQGSPQAGAVARHALKIRWIAGYFGVLVGWLLVTGLYYGRAPIDIGMSLLIMSAAGGLVLGLAWWFSRAVARTTIYTITTRRVVMRMGIALPKAFNLPFAQIESVDVRERGDALGDIALRFPSDVRLNWLIMWPHVRGFRIGRVEPQMICINDVGHVAGQLSMQLHAHVARSHHLDEASQVSVGGGDVVVPFPQAAE